MLDDYKNLKDTSSASPISLKDSQIRLSYTKTNKLITALYIVTDIMDNNDPIRHKLRFHGVALISDINALQQNQPGVTLSLILSRVREMVAFLDMASTVQIISAMNHGILKKEFIELESSLKTYGNTRYAWIEEFLTTDNISTEENISENENLLSRNSQSYKGHITTPSRTSTRPTRLGVQKGSTLMQALSDKALNGHKSSSQDFDLIKKERRYEIIQILKSNEEGYTITDIKSKGHEMKLNSIMNCGEKTLQRELVAMVRDGVLYKKGEKRWSKYSIKK